MGKSPGNKHTPPSLRAKVESGSATKTEAKAYYRSENEERAGRIKDLLSGMYDSKGADETNLVDLLSDIRHFCDVYAVEFAAADRVAHNHYTCEVVQARTGVAE